MEKIEFSLVIPCYNESKNIPHIIKRCKSLLKLRNFELILVNNGSSDNTNKVFKRYKSLKKLKFIKIKKNIGFGNGIMSGIQSSKGKIIGYTHADRQTDPNDFYKCIKKIQNNHYNKIFYKGYRINKLKNGWSWFDIFLTTSQSLFQSCMLLCPMIDIHAQPNIFSKNLIKNIKYFPKDFQIDTFFYYLAKKKNFVIRRQKVNFNKKFRGYGEGNNDSFIKKIKGIFSHIFGTFNLIRIIFLKN